jgi:hypothetical protein
MGRNLAGGPAQAQAPGVIEGVQQTCSRKCPKLSIGVHLCPTRKVLWAGKSLNQQVTQPLSACSTSKRSVVQSHFAPLDKKNGQTTELAN